MVKILMDPEWIIAKGGALMFVGRFLWWIGVGCILLGVIGTIVYLAFDITPGLEPISWLLLAIAAFVASIPEYLGWAVAVYLDTIETKSKKEREIYP